MTDPVALATLLRDYGPWGLLALSLLANLYQYRDGRACIDARIADAGRFATLVEKASQTMAAVAAALESRTGIFERLGSKIEEGNREAEVQAGAVRGSIDELRRAVEAVRAKVAA